MIWRNDNKTDKHPTVNTLVICSTDNIESLGIYDLTVDHVLQYPMDHLFMPRISVYNNIIENGDTYSDYQSALIQGWKLLAKHLLEKYNESSSKVYELESRIQELRKN